MCVAAFCHRVPVYAVPEIKVIVCSLSLIGFTTDPTKFGMLHLKIGIIVLYKHGGRSSIFRDLFELNDLSRIILFSFIV